MKRSRPPASARPPSAAPDASPAALAAAASPPLAAAPEARPVRPWGWPASLAALAVATLGTYAGALKNGWVLFDDPDYILTNVHVRAGLTLAGLRWMMRAPHSGNWHPLTTVVHMLATQAFGLWAGGHHAIGVALHAFNAVMLAVALRRLTGARWRSLLVAALFALHPLRVESVAWVSELKDVLSGAFFMVLVWAYARWSERPGRTRYALVVASLGLGLLAKPMLVTAPFVLVLLDLWPLGRLRGTPGARREGGRAPARSLAGLLLEKWPLLLLAAALSVVTYAVQRTAGAVVANTNLPLSARALNAAISYWRYLGMTLWPHGLFPYYVLRPPVDPVRGAAAIAGLAALTALAVTQLRRRAYLPVGWFWYAGMLVPVAGLVQVGMQSHADRYTYLPAIGLGIAVVWAADEVLPRARAVRIAAAVFAVAVLATLAFATTRQLARWKDNRTLFEYTLALDPRNVVAHQCVGSECLAVGRLPEAIAHFQAALREEPGDREPHMNLATAYVALGRQDEALAEFRAARAIQDDPVVRHNLGLTLMKLGRPDEAIAEYEAGLGMDPDQGPMLVELGAALGSRGRLPAAEASLRHALALRPRDVEAVRLLAMTLTQENRIEDAIREYGAVLRLEPDNLDALNNIAWMRATCADPRHRDGAEAVRLAERAVARAREPAAVLYSTLAAAYAEAGRFPQAVSAGRRAVELARAEHDAGGAARFGDQLAHYEAGRPFHFAP